ncbi:MAG: hypothetical protein ACKO3W_00725 [bacterium]
MSSPQAVTENNPAQDRPVARALALPAGILASALLFALVVPLWTSLRGVAGPTLMESERPLLAALATIAVLAAATGIAIVVARVVNAVVGTFVLGCGVALLAMRTGAAHDFVYSGANLAHSAIETAVWGVFVGAASWAIYRFGGRLPDFPATGDAEIDSPAGPAARRAWFAAALAVVAAWFVLVTDTKGQAIGAATLGAFVAGFLARSLARATQPVYIAAAVLAAFAATFGYIAFSVRGDLAVGLIDGSFPRLLRVMPVDAAAGALLGTSMGFGFARSFVSPPEE